MTVFVLCNYKVDVKAGAHHILLEVYGEEELEKLARILGRSGFDFDVRADHNADTKPDS